MKLNRIDVLDASQARKPNRAKRVIAAFLFVVGLLAGAGLISKQTGSILEDAAIKAEPVAVEVELILEPVEGD